MRTVGLIMIGVAWLVVIGLVARVVVEEISDWRKSRRWWKDRP